MESPLQRQLASLAEHKLTCGTDHKRRILSALYVFHVGKKATRREINLLRTKLQEIKQVLLFSLEELLQSQQFQIFSHLASAHIEEKGDCVGSSHFRFLRRMEESRIYATSNLEVNCHNRCQCLQAFWRCLPSDDIN